MGGWIGGWMDGWVGGWVEEREDGSWVSRAVSAYLELSRPISAYLGLSRPISACWSSLSRCSHESKRVTLGKAYRSESPSQWRSATW